LSDLALLRGAKLITAAKDAAARSFAAGSG
jgi:hypothetical protein